MKFRTLIFAVCGAAALTARSFAGADTEIASDAGPVAVPPFRFSGELQIEESYVGSADVDRGNRRVDDFDEDYSDFRFVYTPRTKIGILRVGTEFERYSCAE